MRPRLANLVEFIVVGGFSLAMIFWVIPAQTMATGSELSLSPQMIPVTCSAAIGLIALGRFLLSLRKKSDHLVEASEPLPIFYALGLFAITLAGVITAEHFGWVAGGVLQTILAVLFLGERRPAVLICLPVGAAIVLYLIGKTGI